MGGSYSPYQSGPNGSGNNDILNKLTEVRDVISNEDASKINGLSLGINDSQNGAVTTLAPQVSLQLQQQHLPPGPVVRWDRILPVRTVKVLLVESDDSTRQVVSALLRNCSYEVSAAADGLQAWKILENPTNHVDLVLTEVTMPSLNGIGLLSKIMSNDACKNIPVIMMSSNDSMGTVFKCLSKGAVDFLVKPIRKNELKNLWQHVWRRSHSSSGSVSESGIHIQKSGKSRSVNECDNVSSSDDEDDVASMGLNARDGSDNGSGTQSSWTKHAVEIDSPQPMSPTDQLADPHDSTCAQVISDTEAFPNKRVLMTDIEHGQKQKKHTDELMGKDLEIGVPRTSELHPKFHHTKTKSTKQADINVDYHSEIETNKKNEDAFVEHTKAAYLIGGIANNADTQPINDTDEPSKKDKNIEGSNDLPSLRLSLKRSRLPGEGAISTHDERNILRRSDQSAFSRYRNSAASTQAQTACVGSCSPVDNSSDVLKTESTQNMVSNSNPVTLKQGSNESSDNNDKGSTTNPATCKEKTASTVLIKGNHPSAFHPVQIQTSTQPIPQENINEPDAAKFQYQVQHHHHHYHHHHHHVHNTQNSSENDELAAKNMTAVAYVSPVEGNGSNSGSNGQNMSGTIAENANGASEKGAGNGNGSGSGSASGVDQNRIAQREAALIKFRQKRKERNFEKKVRYYSRKKLAEQRPRVRGQFVRQPSVPESKSRGGDS